MKVQGARGVERGAWGRGKWHGAWGMGQGDRAFARCLVVCLLLLFFVSCGKKEASVREEFSTPEKTYKVWMEAGATGDLARSMECITEASKRMMDQQAKNRDEFIRRMVSSSAVFRGFSVVDRKVSDDKAVILIESPDKKGRIAIPFAMEADGWKVDLVGMFGG